MQLQINTKLLKIFIAVVTLSILVVIALIMISGQAPTSADNANIAPNSHDYSQYQMNHGPVTSEKQFIYEMIPHHEEAVVTSKYILERGASTDLKHLAQEIITAQEKEIADMKRWYKEWYGEEYQTNTGYQPMMGNLTKISGRELDKQYTSGMIFHHEGAISMAQNAKKLELHPEVSELVENILSSQKREVEYMKELLPKL